MVRSKIIDRAMGMIMKGELARATTIWKKAHFGAVISGLLQLPHKCARRKGVLWEATPSAAPDSPTPKGFCLDEIQGHVHTTQRVTIPQFGTMNIHSQTDVWGHCMEVHMLTEPAQGPWLSAFIVLTATYGELHQGSSWVPVYLRNLSAHPIVIPTKVIINKVTQPTSCHQ